jgi:prepilin signal peptidase PulO-like enzyme (type II secretory pathway)
MVFVYFLIFLFGLVFGSFVNVLVWRLPRKMSILGRSICPKCKKKIFWFDNLPLVSYLLLKGKCRNCREKISWRYPLVELASGMGFLALFIFPHPFPSFFLLIIFTIFLAIFVIDLISMIVPDALVFTGILATFVFFIFFDHPDFFVHLFSGFAAAGFLLVIHLLTRGKGMGLGDVKLALLSGFILGYPLSLVWLFLAFLTGAFVGSILILLRKAKFGKPIPFGPFLVFSFFLTIFLFR